MKTFLDDRKKTRIQDARDPFSLSARSASTLTTTHLLPLFFEKKEREKEEGGGWGEGNCDHHPDQQLGDQVPLIIGLRHSAGADKFPIDRCQDGAANFLSSALCADLVSPALPSRLQLSE